MFERCCLSRLVERYTYHLLAVWVVIGVVLCQVDIRDPFDNMVARGLYDTWLEHPGSAKAQQVLHTSYHQREKNVAAQLSNW